MCRCLEQSMVLYGSLFTGTSGVPFVFFAMAVTNEHWRTNYSICLHDYRHFQSWARDNTDATTWPFFRPRNYWLLHYISVATPFKHRDLNIFSSIVILTKSVFCTLSRSVCRKAKNCRVPSANHFIQSYCGQPRGVYSVLETRGEGRSQLPSRHFDKIWTQLHMLPSSFPAIQASFKARASFISA